MRQHHVAGDKLFVDYSGKKIPIVDPRNGEVREAEIFVGAMGVVTFGLGLRLLIWALEGNDDGWTSGRHPAPPVGRGRVFHGLCRRGVAPGAAEGRLRSGHARRTDRDRLDAGTMRPSIGAVTVRSGNFVSFDTKTHKIGPEHIMASGALPPGFRAIEIKGEHYWHGGLVSNTPLQWVVDSQPRINTLAFQVDLWSARGELPRTLAEVSTRKQENSVFERYPCGDR
jgi:hypothetical protein